MLIEPKFTNKLSPTEALNQLKESTNAYLEQNRLVNQDELINAEARMGRGMMHTEFVRRVAKLTRNDVWPEVSNADPNVVGLYRMYNGAKQYLSAFNAGWIPEYTIVFENERKQPVGQKRGWRDVLKMLKSKRILTNRQIVSAFGHPRTGFLYRSL